METISTAKRSRGPWLVAGSVGIALLATSGRYGFHRDELYFVVAGRRLDWGFVDQPPFTPLIARVSETLFGTSPTSLRLVPTIAIVASALLAASMSRRFGGGARAQALTAIGAGASGIALAFGHLLSTATFDYFFWTLGCWLVVRILDDGARPSMWMALGVTVGIGLQNKHLIGFFAAAILVGLIVDRREMLRSRWPWIGVAIALGLALPNLLWQAANDFPQLEMAEALARRSNGPAAFVLEQIGLLSVVLAVPLVAGLAGLVRSAELRKWRPLAVAFAVLFVTFLLTGGKSYYMAPMYPVGLAASAGWIERLGPRQWRALAGATGVGVVIGAFIALPLLPPSSMAGFDPTGELGETYGWPELIDQIAAVYETIPESRRAEAVILTASYGEAGAIDVIGAERGLPAAASGHNNYWLWGPPAEHGPVIAVGFVGRTLERICPTVEQVGTITNPADVPNEELGGPLYLCLEPTGQLADIWDDVRHYN